MRAKSWKWKQPMSISLEKNYFATDSRFWETWRGHIVRAIVSNQAYTKDKILRVTSLKEEAFGKALKELFQENLLEEREKGKFWVKRELYGKCKSFFEYLQETLVNWVSEWINTEEIANIFGPNPSHFFLADRLLSRFSESLIEQAKQEILVTSPYVKRCHISEALALMTKKGVCVKLVTRGIESQQFEKELAKRVFINYDESVHAKVIVVDRRVGIVSSMNFYASSSAGQSWEAGIITTNETIVYSIINSIQERFLSAGVE
jgi:hypothetical protein